MFSYLVRRLLYTVPILLGVYALTFVLFFSIQSPETMARMKLGKNPSPQAVQLWLHNRGFDKPAYFNTKPGEKLFDSIFFNQLGNMVRLDFGKSLTTDLPLRGVVAQGAIPSLLITGPAFLLALWLSVAAALYLVFLRDSKLDTAGTVICVALMSIPAMVYIIFGQSITAIGMKYFPAFGFELNGFGSIKFLLLPIILMVVVGLGTDIRLYRSIFLEEFRQDYVRTAFAKGVPLTRVLNRHVLKNGMIALITLTVTQLPRLILGSLLMENFFGIPGLGNQLYLAIQTADFTAMMAFVFLGAVMFQAGLIATDICYALVDPRIRLS